MQLNYDQNSVLKRKMLIICNEEYLPILKLY